MKVGDVIRYHDAEELLKYDEEARAADILTDFCCEVDGQRGYWLVIVESYEEKDG
jgi:hypothetical protein